RREHPSRSRARRRLRLPRLQGADPASARSPPPCKASITVVRLALSEISTVNASFAEDVAAYAAAGFDAIGIWEFKLDADDAASHARLRAAGLAVANCVPAVPSILQLDVPGMHGPGAPRERVAV